MYDIIFVLKNQWIFYASFSISFRPKTSADRDYIHIVNGPTGCWSSVGRISGQQEVNLQSPYCTTKVGTPLHEMMHAIGFLHEQNRYERDDFVSIAWSNIRGGKLLLAKKIIFFIHLGFSCIFFTIKFVTIIYILHSK